jgi:hypothetical protein
MAPRTGTIWPEHFSEEGFLKIKLGMTSAQVRFLVGDDPLEKYCDPTGCWWRYSGQDSVSADSDRRWVTLDTHDRVVEIVHRFYID